MTTRLAWACCIAPLLPLVTAEAQLIRVKTIPVAESEQFSFLPSAGMAGVSIALADTLLDPYVNPAKGGRAPATQYFGAPSFFSVSGNAGAGTTFPLGAMWKRGASFASLGAAFQQIHRRNDEFFPSARFGADILSVPGPGVPSESRPTSSQRNNYTFALFGHTFNSARLSFGASALWSGLGAVDGVEQFYVGNDWLRQKGEAVDLRFGLLKEWANGQSLEAVAVRNQFHHAHDVGFTDVFWDPAERRPFGVSRTEHSGERTGTWGVHLEYERPLSDSGWRAGALVTGNRISHGRIPTYELLNGLGTTGQSSAFNLGVGVSRSRGAVVFGIDAIYEPITSSTLESDTLRNHFRFSNAKVRAGVSRSFTLLEPGSTFKIQIGAELYSNSYVMNQRDQTNAITRVRKETWLERTRTAGMSFRVPGIEVHYHVRTKTGVGRPGVINVNDSPPIGLLTGSSSVWMPPVPTAAALGAVRVTWHQFAISIPNR
jgi:hypothetical protein